MILPLRVCTRTASYLVQLLQHLLGGWPCTGITDWNAFCPGTVNITRERILIERVCNGSCACLRILGSDVWSSTDVGAGVLLDSMARKKSYQQGSSSTCSHRATSYRSNDSS
jgi:hypothetical protein